MFRKCLILVGVVLLVASASRAEPMRTLLCKENKLPGAQKLELGMVAQYTEISEDNVLFLGGGDEYWATPYVRYGALENLALFANVPYGQIEPNLGESESGLGDVSVGFELVGYQDVLGYPWVMPHLAVSLDTGDEETGLGSGNTVVTPGVSIGTTVENIFHWVLDARYAFNNSDENGGNVASIQGAFIWDLSQQFSLLVEGRGSDDNRWGQGHPAWFQAGMTYKATENLMFGVYGGGGQNTREDTFASLKVAYTF